ncbi:MAG: response regulator [Phycisphaerae bacterium]|nr:response regulator [Phycisphaerae bacterium]
MATPGNPTSRPSVLTVGHCAPDHAALAGVLARAGAKEIRAADTTEEAVSRYRELHPDLTLVNRIFDLDGASGLDLIARLTSAESESTPVMLVSNYADVQQQAVAAGALPGFGKNDLHSPELLERLMSFLSRSAPFPQPRHISHEQAP